MFANLMVGVSIHSPSLSLGKVSLDSEPLIVPNGQSCKLHVIPLPLALSVQIQYTCVIVGGSCKGKCCVWVLIFK